MLNILYIYLVAFDLLEPLLNLRNRIKTNFRRVCSNRKI